MVVIDASGDFIDSEVGTRIGGRAAELQAMHDYQSPSLSWLLDL